MHEDIKAWLDAREAVKLAIKKEREAEEKADMAPLPESLHPAEASDITVGAIIWYPKHYDPEDGCSGWEMVEEPLHYGDDWKAYCSHSGCRYGLEGAFVEKEKATSK